MTDEMIAAQTIIAGSEQTSWQRWTIDEIDEDVVRVLITSAQDPAQARGLSTSLIAAASGSESATSVGIRLSDVARDQAMDVETGPIADRWEEEVAAFAERQPLQRFLRRRGGKPGLPRSRPLREGDVFWVIAPRGLPSPGAPTRDNRRLPLESYLELGVDVWDVTAAARQASKRRYHEVQRAVEDAPEEPVSG